MDAQNIHQTIVLGLACVTGTVATANTMLLLSRLYSYSSDKFFRFLKSEYFSDAFEPELVFSLQEKSEDSVPDATITQAGFKLVVETKMSDWFYSDQLMRHLKSFKDEKTKALITIAPELMAEKKKSDFEKELKKYNALQEFPVIHANTTFEILAEAIRSVLDEGDYEMQDVLDDYLNYCYNNSLIVISDSWKWMRVQLAGTTFKFKMAKDLYYDNIDRGFRAHDYLGLYTGKSVRAIGKITDIVTTGRDGTGALTYTVEKGKLTNEMKEKIACAIADGKNYGYELKATRYFFVESFFETDYKKDTSYAPRGSRIFDLTQILGMDTLPPVSEIAEGLKVKTWSYGQLYHAPVA